MAKKKYYVVWVGNEPGIYESWNACKAQINNFPNAKYRSYKSRAAAERAFKGAYEDSGSDKKVRPEDYREISEIDMSAVAVDAACSGNPGKLEYRGVKLSTAEEIFRVGPLNKGTNNVGEFLAIVHALALFHKQDNDQRRIYTDSKIAMSWIRKGRANTKLQKSSVNKTLFVLLQRAETWLSGNRWDNPITKWKTRQWGEIPADFGRK